MGALSRTILATFFLTMSFSGCAAPPQSVLAQRCYVVEGSRDRYLEIDKLSRSLASAAGLQFEGENSAALVIKGASSRSRIVVSSPFGPDASIIALYRIDQDNIGLDEFLDRLLIRIADLNLVTKDCSAVPGVRVPSIHGDLSD